MTHIETRKNSTIINAHQTTCALEKALRKILICDYEETMLFTRDKEMFETLSSLYPIVCSRKKALEKEIDSRLTK